MLCATDRCRHQTYAVAVTDDGYANRAALALPARHRPFLTAAGQAAFHVDLPGKLDVLVGGDGRQTPVVVSDDVRPLDAGEVLVPGAVARPVALDPDTATTHRVPLPAGTTHLPPLQQEPSGRLVGVGYGQVIWSDDGGASWEEHVLPVGERALYAPVLSADGDTIAVVAGSDGATVFPFLAVHRSADGGATWEVFEQSRRPLAYIEAQLVRPDGSLLVNLLAWSDGTLDRPSANPVGLYESDGADWTDITYVDPGFVRAGSAESQRDWTPSLLDVVVHGDRQDLYATDAGGGSAQVYVSTDGGHTWESTRSR